MRARWIVAALVTVVVVLATLPSAGAHASTTHGCAPARFSQRERVLGRIIHEHFRIPFAARDVSCATASRLIRNWYALPDRCAADARRPSICRVDGWRVVCRHTTNGWWMPVDARRGRGLVTFRRDL